MPWEQATAIDATPAFVIEPALPEASLIDSLRRLTRSIAPHDFLIGPETMRARRERQLAFPRYRMVFAAAAAGLALFFSTAGLYGLIAASLAQRRREMGVRLAVGANRRDVGLIFVRRSLKWTLPAAALGMLGAGALISAYNSLLEGVSPSSVPAYAVALAALALAAVLGTLLPVRRALKSDVMASLRAE